MSDKVIDSDLGKRDILESEIPRDVLDILLKDRTTGKNILWMTESRPRLKLTLCFCVVLPDNGTMFSSLCCAPRGDGHQACHGERTGRIRFETFNAQYPRLAVRYNETFHDRFLIIDDKELYLIGASLKDLGRKCFGFTKMDAGEIDRIKKVAYITFSVDKSAKENEK